MDTFVPLPNSKNDVDIHKLCMYGHIQELRVLLGIPDPNAPAAEAPKEGEEDPTSPDGSDDELDGGDSAVSPPNSPLGSPKGSPREPSVANLDSLDGLSSAGQTALSLCAAEGHLECLKVMLTQGADIGTPCSGGMQALHHGANRYQEACMEALIAGGADVNAPTDTGLTPTYISVTRGVLACVKMLVAAGGDVTFTTTQGGSLMHVATINGNVGLLTYLTEVSNTCKCVGRWLLVALDVLHKLFFCSFYLIFLLFHRWDWMSMLRMELAVHPFILRHRPINLQVH